MKRDQNSVAFRTLLLCVALLCTPSAKADWPTALPEEVGIDSAVLVEMLDYVRHEKVPIHSVQIVRDGKMVLDAYFYPFRSGARHDLASVTKSITSTLIGIALDRGLLKGTGQPLSDLFPERKIKNRDARKEKVTLQHLLTMQAGWDCGFETNELRLAEMRASPDWTQFMLDLSMVTEPGTRWAYCSGNCHLLSALLSRVTGTNAISFARKELFGPLGITNIRWPADTNGNSHGWGDLQMTPTDMVKIGQLFLQGGEWNGRRIVSEKWIQEATRSHVEKTSNNDGYGYYWWLKSGDLAGMFEAVGRGGQRITIWPAKNLVVVFTGGGFEPGNLGKFILKSLKSEPLNPNPAVFSKLQQQLLDAKAQPVSRPLATPPAITKAISGKSYLLESNKMSVAEMKVAFIEPAYAEFDLLWNQTLHPLRVSLDEVERFARSSLIDQYVAAKGQWLNELTFQLQLDLVGGINFYDIRMTFASDGKTVELEVTERTGLLKERFWGISKE